MESKKNPNSNQKKEINLFLVLLLYINIVTAAGITFIKILNQYSATNNFFILIISLVFILIVIIGLVLMIQVKKIGLYIFFSTMILPILYLIFFTTNIDKFLIIKLIMVPIIWYFLLFIKKNGRSAWDVYLDESFNENNQVNSLEDNKSIEKESKLHEVSKSESISQSNPKIKTIKLVNDNNSKTPIQKEFKILFRLLLASLVISSVLLMVNYLIVNKQQSIYLANKTERINTEKHRIINLNWITTKQYNRNLYLFNKDLQTYIKDSTDYPTQYQEYEILRKIEIKEFNKYEGRHKSWVSKLCYQDRKKYNEISNRQKEANDNSNDEIKYEKNKMHISRNEVAYYLSGDCTKDSKWLLEKGEPIFNDHFSCGTGPNFPVKPKIPQKPNLTNKIVIKYPSYESFYETNSGFWEISFERNLLKNILPTFILVTITTLIIRYLLLLIIFIVKKTKKFIAKFRSISFIKLLKKVLYNLFPFENKGTKRLVLSITILSTVLWTIAWTIYYNNKTVSNGNRWHERFSDYKMVTSDYIIIFSSFVFIPILYIIGVWIYRGYIESQKLSKK